MLNIINIANKYNTKPDIHIYFSTTNDLLKLVNVVNCLNFGVEFCSINKEESIKIIKLSTKIPNIIVHYEENKELKCSKFIIKEELTN